MAAQVFATGFLEYTKVFFVAVMIYAIIFAMLKKIDILGHDNKINSLVALLAAVIVSFSGVVTYAVSYAVNWFIIIFFIIFLLLTLLMFLGVKMGDITSQVTKNGKTIVTVFAVLFLIIVVKGFFALNNAYDLNNPPSDQYTVDASYNTGVDDITNTDIKTNPGFWGALFNVNSDVVASVIFLIAVGVVVMFISG